MHESRLWAGKDRERFEECDCMEAACGYVIPDEGCPQHSMGAMKSVRRAHREEDCGGVNHHPGVAEPDHAGPARTER